jgi:AraC-like DNA-binding protein
VHESELDRYLRRHTELELVFLDPASLQDSMSDADEASVLDGEDLRAIPATRRFFIELSRHPEKFTLLDEDTYIPRGQNIAFVVHPRYAVLPSHRHSFIELIYVYSGQCSQIINNAPVTMQKGEMCILDTHAFHSINKADENDIIINCLMRKSFFDAALLGRLSGNDVFSQFFIKAIYRSKNFEEYILLHSSENEKIQRLMTMILCEYYDKGMCSNEVINSYMIILFAEMLRVYRKDINSRHFAVLENTKVSDIIRYLEKNYKDVTLESAAKHFYFHPTHLSKILRKLTGTRFIDIIHQVKANQAGILLKTTDLPVNMVANEVGYENVSFFYQIFKKHFGCTPSLYRKKASQGIEPL